MITAGWKKPDSLDTTNMAFSCRKTPASNGDISNIPKPFYFHMFGFDISQSTPAVRL